MNYGYSSVEPRSNILTGRPYGGTAILYRKCLISAVNFVKTDNPRVTAITLNANFNDQITSVLLASMYMPVLGADNDSDFEFVCGLLKALILECNVNSFLFAGDFFLLVMLIHLDKYTYEYVERSQNLQCWLSFNGRKQFYFHQWPQHGLTMLSQSVLSSHY